MSWYLWLKSAAKACGNLSPLMPLCLWTPTALPNPIPLLASYCPKGNGLSFAFEDVRIFFAIFNIVSWTWSLIQLPGTLSLIQIHGLNTLTDSQVDTFAFRLTQFKDEHIIRTRPAPECLFPRWCSRARVCYSHRSFLLLAFLPQPL